MYGLVVASQLATYRSIIWATTLSAAAHRQERAEEPWILAFWSGVRTFNIARYYASYARVIRERARWVTRKGIGEAGQKLKAQESPRPIQNRIECAGLPGVQVPGLEPCPWELPVDESQPTNSHATLVNTPLLHETDTFIRLAKSFSANIRREALCRVERFLMLPWQSPSPGDYA
jgi:hypothetical protein